MQPYQMLEREWAEWNGLDIKGMVVCSSGTAALHLGIECLEIERDGRPQVILPDFTMVSCARAVVLSGLWPIFADCNRKLIIDPQCVANRMTDNSRAIMAVHIYGRVCDMTALSEHTLKEGMFLIEDLAESHGIKPHPKTDAACWSFYRNKIVHGEEGGAVYFKDPERAKHARRLRSLGFTKDHDFSHIPRGQNYRLSNVHADLIVDSLREAHKNIQSRRIVESWYDEYMPNEWRMSMRDVPWVYDFRIDGMLSEEQDQIVSALNKLNWAARHAFKPMTRQREFHSHTQNVNACAASQEVIYLPIYPKMNKGQVDQVVGFLKEEVDNCMSA